MPRFSSYGKEYGGSTPISRGKSYTRACRALGAGYFSLLNPFKLAANPVPAANYKSKGHA
jgi:hypothetical protein